MPIKPILHRILVKPDNLEDKDEAFGNARRAGIIIPKSEKEREQAAIDSGTVLEVGPTAFKDFGAETPPIKAGDHVVYAKYGGKVIVDPVDNEKYVALNDEDVIAIFTK